MKLYLNDLVIFLLTFVFSVAAIFAQSWQSCLFWLILSLLQLSLTGNVKWKYLLLFSFLMILPLLSVFFTSYLHLKANIIGSEIFFAGIKLDSYRLAKSLYLTIRAYSLSMISFSFLTAISYDRLIYSLAQNVKLPVEWAYALMAAFNSTSRLKNEFLRIRQAAMLRFEKKPAFFFYMIPLLVSAARYSQQTAMSMQARGLNPNKTFVLKMKFKVVDWLFLSINIIGVLVLSNFIK